MPSLPTSCLTNLLGELGGDGEKRCPLARLLCSSGSVCQTGRKRAWSHQPTLRRNSPETSTLLPPHPRASASFFREVVREGNFWKLEGGGCGAKWGEVGQTFRRRPSGPKTGFRARRLKTGAVGGRGRVRAGAGGGSERRRGRRPPGTVPRPASWGRRRRRSGDRPLVRGCGKRPRSQPAETPPPPPHLVEEPGRAAQWGLGTEGRRAEGRRLRGKGPLGVRRCSICHRRAIGAQGPWARSPEAEVAGGRGGGRREVAVAAGR